MAQHDDPDYFPPVSWASRQGLLMIGGRLDTDWVLHAYRRGIFPWPMVDGEHEVLAWFSPDPRAVIELDQLHVSRRLARRIRGDQYRVTSDRAFAAVMRGCAAPRARESGTWITPEMIHVYCELHELGHAHSVEVWRGEELVGGLYGISLGAFFAGESMFHTCRDSSKIAIVALVAHLQARGFQLFDVQQATEHAVRMGATVIPRNRFLARLRAAIDLPVTFGHQLDTSILPRLLHPSER
jgi:leucyl/phenylalanyl-tRNA--protein transferase